MIGSRFRDYFLCCTPVRRRFMPRRGWHSSDVQPPQSSPTFTSVQQSTQGSRSERQCRSPTIGGGHFGVGGDEPTRQASGGSVAVCCPSSPAEDLVLQTLHRTRQAACCPSRGSDHESRRAGDLRGRSCRGREETSTTLVDLLKEREMWKVAKKQGLVLRCTSICEGDPANSRQCARSRRSQKIFQMGSPVLRQ